MGKPSITTGGPIQGYELQKVILLTRHGDRTPLHTMNGVKWKPIVWNCSLNLAVSQLYDEKKEIPKTLYQKVYMKGKESLLGNCKLGQLTAQGAMQNVQLGQRFHDIYVKRLNFLPSVVNRSLMFMRSTDVERTVLSSYNFMNGLYPDYSGILTVNVVERKKDDLGGLNTILCPKLKVLKNLIMKSTQYGTIYDQWLGPIAKKYSQVWNVSIDRTNIHVLNDILQTRICHNFSLPWPMQHEEAKNLLRGINGLDNLIYSNHTILSLSKYSLLETWQRILRKNAAEKFFYFSAHAGTIRAMMHIFQDFEPLPFPPLASHMIIELWSPLSDISKPSLVTIQYDGKLVMLREPCSSSSIYCSLYDFLALIQGFSTNKDKCI